MRRRRVEILTAVLAVRITSVLPAAAQITTGTVKDAQVAVTPGASVILIG